MRAWEPEFIRRWEAGETCEQIAAALSIAEGTARSRAFTLQQEGKIQPRPKGGRRERRPSPEHPERSSMPVHNAVQNGAVQVHNSAEVPIPTALAAELTRLWAAIEALREGLHPTVQNTVQSFPEPLFDDPADNTTERWNLYLKRGLRVRIEALARARGVAPSRVVQEILWQALTNHRCRKRCRDPEALPKTDRSAEAADTLGSPAGIPPQQPAAHTGREEC